MQVLGINPHQKASKYQTSFLATKIMMAMKLPNVSGEMHDLYATHLAVLV